MFKISKRAIGTQPPIEYVEPTASEAFSMGEVLVLTSGKATKAGATATPEFVCQKTYTAPASGAEKIPVIRITEDMEFETKAQAELTSVNVGDKVTLHTDGLQVTATTTSGVFMITEEHGTAAGSTVRGMFRR